MTKPVTTTSSTAPVRSHGAFARSSRTQGVFCEASRRRFVGNAPRRRRRFLFFRSLRRREPGKDLLAITRLGRRAIGNIEPDFLPQRRRWSVLARAGNSERDERPAAAQRGAMSSTARGRKLLKRIQRHRRAGARQNSHAAALDEQVLVQFDRVGAWASIRSASTGEASDFNSSKSCEKRGPSPSRKNALS